MSGHSKWHNIQAKKNKTDAQRGKIFTKIGRELAVAVKEGGPDVNSNAKLRLVVQKAKDNNMPNDNINKAIKKASGELGNVNYESIIYEGYGVGGSAVLVECLTDNKNRSAGDVRHAFDKNGGSLGSNGCVSYLFNRKGVIIVEKGDLDSDTAFLLAIEAGAEDIIEEEDCFEIYTTPESLQEVSDNLQNQPNVNIVSREVAQVPNMYVELDENQINTFEKMIDMLDDSDDVQNIYHNVKL